MKRTCVRMSLSIYANDGDVRLDGWTGDTLKVETVYGELITGTLTERM